MFNGLANMKKWHNTSWTDMDGSNVLAQHFLRLNDILAKVEARKSALKEQLWALFPWGLLSPETPSLVLFLQKLLRPRKKGSVNDLMDCLAYKHRKSNSSPRPIFPLNYTTGGT